MNQTVSPADTGEHRFPFIDDNGRTRDLSPYAALLPPARRPDVTGEIVAYHPQTIGVVDFDGPQLPPPPLPPVPKLDLAAAQPIAPLERVLVDAPLAYLGRHRAPLSWLGQVVEVIALAWDRVKSS